MTLFGRQLLEKPKVVLVDVDGLDLATFKVEDVYAIVFDVVARGWHPQEFALVRCCDRPAHSDLVQFATGALYFKVDVGKGVAQVANEPGHSFEPGDGRRLRWDDELEIGRHDLFDH